MRAWTQLVLKVLVVGGLGWLGAGCDTKTCEPNTLQCSPLKNRIEQCNADGSAVETVRQCPGNTCVEEGGTAFCDDGTEPVCTPGERQCGPLRNRVEVCNADGSAFETESTCAGNTCVDAGGDVRCDDPEPECTPGETRCDPTRPQVVEECRTTGDGWFDGTTCGGALTCVEVQGRGAQCQSCVPGSTYCGTNNAGIDVCNSDGTALEPGDACVNNSCKLLDGSYRCELPCTPGATRCGLANQGVQTCNAEGTAWETTEGCLNNSCRGPYGSAACEETPICNTGETRCSAVAGNVIEECNVRGDGWYEDTRCPGLLQCRTTESGSGVCQFCVPGATRCGANNASAEVCNAAGTAYELSETCSSNSCKFLGGEYTCELPCTPGTARCGSANQTVEVCDDEGDAFVFAERCLDNSCTTEFGPATCRSPQVCTPGARRCSASAVNQVEQCRNDGRGWFLQQTCGGLTECIGSGTCQTCVPGSRICGANNASVQVCNAAGTGYELLAACDDNSCGFIDGAFACEYPCAPGATRCAFNRSRIEVCNAGGTNYDAGETCLNNSCGYQEGEAICGATPVCTPGERRCSATTPGIVEQCRTTADDWFAQTTCGGTLTCTTASGSAACQVCNPGSTRCGANNASVEVCNAAGTGFEAGEACTANSCGLIGGVSACEFPCETGATRCASNASQVQVCNASGNAYELAEACVNNSCRALGEVAFCSIPQVCTPGARRCSQSAANQVEQCRTDGAGWFTQTTCPGTLQCTVTASGGEGCQVCTPGTRYCGANNGSVMQCNPAGTAFEVAETCTNNSCRIQNGQISCEFPCAPGTLRCSALRNRVEVCNATGDGVETVATCVENSCTEALGEAFCEPPPVECIAGQTRCSPLGTVVQVCSDAGRWESGETCATGACQVVSGVAACPEPVCQPNLFFCGEDGNVRYCTARGQDGGIQKTCGGEASCRVLDGAAQCVAPEVPMSCLPNLQFCGDDGVIYYCNSQGQVSGVPATCDDDEVCVYDANAPMCLGGYYETTPEGETVCVVTEPSACVIIPKAFTTYGYVYATTEKTSCENDGRVTEECSEHLMCIDGACASSVNDETSPYYERSCRLVQQLAYPTDLEADCRCFVNNSIISGVPICGRPYDRADRGHTVGAGPRIYGLPNAHFSGGFVEGDELIVAAYWGSSTAQRGAVLAIDVDSGDRRLVSGELGELSVGSGPAFTYALDVRKGADGNWYVFTQSVTPGAPSIFRVNPTTGNRTLVWKGQSASHGQCASGDPDATASVQYTNQGFAVDGTGGFILGYANPIRDGRGLVRISPDGSSCTYITATGLREDGLTRGSGLGLGGFVQGFMVDGTKVLVHTTQPKALIEVDLTTGDRTALFSSSTAGNIGERWAVKDPARGVIWTAGLMNAVSIVAYDRAKNKTMNVFSSCGDPDFPWYPLCPGAGPVKINSLNYGGIWLHPRTGNLLIAQDSVSIIEFEPETANSVIRSL